ncbi:TAZ zinc finger protein [Medicago truncatula]|uniref:histone acetyltransferase n=1 Tax=Medicago truncatula TaxID=3880 RepID=A0A072VT38_MEDTR|nr:TAZ zinc finger protein [Medicago truncatula]
MIIYYIAILMSKTPKNANIYDHFFFRTEKGNSKVTASRLSYFDGDCWCSNAMEVAETFGKESGGDYEKRVAIVDDIPSDSKHNDIVLESGLFENRDNFLSFYQKTLSFSLTHSVLPKNWESNEEMMVKLLNVLKHASQCRTANSEPCSHPHCMKISFIQTAHSRNCKDSERRIPRCSDLKKHVEQRSMHSESCRRAVVGQ